MSAHAVDPVPGLRVLVIEDQHDIAANIWDFLERRGYQVDHCADGASGLARAMGDVFDAIVLDLGLPRLDGLDLCRQLRASGHGVPVLMLTARDTLDDKLRGYAEGADDYMVKPFAMRELDARLRALTRHAMQPVHGLGVGGLHYEPQAMLAIREGQRIPLTRLQGALLAALLRNHPNISTHQSLLRAGWGGQGGDLPALQTQIYDLRALVDRPFAQPMIQSVRGVGYRMVVPA
ncbi:MAG: response regulator transcription factor [Lysobacteraceae bacterium]|nr:MAG: response regulator transcription factor [Xanthomonadaceae bacterium]